MLRAGLLSALAFVYVLIVNRPFDASADADVKGVPLLVVILGLVALLMSYVCANTPFGRHLRHWRKS